MITKFLGIIASICFGCCGVPAAYKTLRAGKSIGTPVSIALMILGGSVTMYSYLTISHGFDLILTVNYSTEIISWGIIAVYHFWRPV